MDNRHIAFAYYIHSYNHMFTMISPISES